MAKPLGAQQEVSLQMCTSPRHMLVWSVLCCFQFYFTKRFSSFMKLQEHLPLLLPGSCFWWPHLEACRILVPWRGTEPALGNWKHKVLRTGPPGKSLAPFLLSHPVQRTGSIFPPKWSSFSSLLVSANMSPP